MTWEYQAKLVRIIDGDTVELLIEKEFSIPIDFGFYIKEEVVAKKSVQLHFRLRGINSPELGGATYAAGKAAKEYLTSLLENKALRVITYKPDKYGRWLIDIFYRQQDSFQEINVCEEMVRSGHALFYMQIK